MNKIVIAGILVAIAIASIGLVTAGNGFDPDDRIGECDNVCNSQGYGSGDGTCNGDGTRECAGNCKQYGVENGICDEQCDVEKNKNQYNGRNCNKNSNSNGCC